MPAKTTAAKGHGLKRKLFGLPVWAWAGVIGGGVIIGVYLRRKGSAASSASTDTTQSDGTLGAGASPSDNGGSSSMDLQGFLDAQGQLLDQFGSGLQDLLAQTQGSANWGSGGFGDTSGGDGSGDSTGTVTSGAISLGPYNQGGDLNLSTLTPAALKAAWADYRKATPMYATAYPNIKASTTGTTVKVPGGAFTQVSASRPAQAAAKKVKAIFVAKHGTERAHWALPSGRWVSGPGYY
jgi:hypothetical protein